MAFSRAIGARCAVLIPAVRPDESGVDPTSRHLELPFETGADRRRGCAGLQLDFPDEQFRGLPEAWVPFEYAVVVGWS